MVQAIEIKFKFFGEWEMGVAPGRQNMPQEAQEAPGEPQDTKTSPRTPYGTRYVEAFPGYTTLINNVNLGNVIRLPT